MLREKEKAELSTLFRSEPLTNATEDKRRNLLFTSCASILLTVYNLKINKTPWLDIEVPSGAPGILNGAISVALLYTFLVFIFHAWTDLHRWHLARDLLRLDEHRDAITRVANHLNGLEHTVKTHAPHAYTEEHRTSMFDSLRDGFKFLSAITEDFRSLKRSHRALSTIQVLRLTMLDVGAPVVLGIFALYKIGPALLPFILATINHA